MKILYLFLFLSLGTLLGCNSDSKENLIVMVKYKTQQNKNVDAIVALKSLINEVEKEEHFVGIKMYVDPNDNSNILLTEEWENETYFKNGHMKTEHLQKFMNESASFLAGPPEISYWKFNSSY